MLCRTWCLVTLGLVLSGFSLYSSAEKLPKCALAGRITNHPSTGFSVRLRATEKNPRAIYDGYSAPVAADGRFHFEDIAPGKYVLVAYGPGFVPAEYGAAGPGESGTPIALTAGQHRAGIVITLARKRLICGKVTDENGSPQAHTEIYVYSHRKGTNWLTFDDFESMHTVTDAQGNYSVDVDPGEYFVQAGIYTWFTVLPNLKQIQKESLANAEPVEVGAGDPESCHTDIRVGERTGWFGRQVSVKIANDPALSGKNLTVSLLEVSRTGASRPWPSGGTLDPDGSFEFRPPAGRYRLVLANGRFPQNWEGALPPEFHVLAWQDITVPEGDLGPVTLRADPLASVSGQVKLVGVTLRAACPTQQKLHVGMQKSDDGQFLQMEPAADGSFSFPQIALGTYTVQLYPFLRGSTYVKELEFDGHAIAGREIQITAAGPHRLEVVLSGDPAGAAGHITPDEPLERYEEAWAHPKASVSGKVANALAGNPPRVKLWALRYNSERSYEYSTRPEPDGTFHFENVDPGLYLLLTQGTGYVVSEYGAAHPGLQGRALNLKAGQEIQGLQLAAFPSGPSICGKVTDENGKPVANVPLHGWFQAKDGGHPVDPNGIVSTDADGVFRFLDLKPGQYFIWASPFTQYALGGGNWAEQATYFPSSRDLGGAQPVQVGFTPDTGCKHDIRMQRQSGFHVRGKLPSELPHAADEYYALSLTETNSAGVEGGSRGKMMLEPGDAFDLADVHPGHYAARLTGPWKKPTSELQVTGENVVLLCTPQSKFAAVQEVVITDHDLNDLTLAPKPRISVTGVVTYEDIPKEMTGFSLGSQTVGLTPNRRTCPAQTQLDAQGNFSLEVDEGTYHLDAGLQGRPFYLKSVRFNDQPVEDGRIALQPGHPAKLSVVVSGKAGEVDVTVSPSVPAEDYRYDEPCRPKMAVAPQAFLIPDPIPKDASGVLTGGYYQPGYVGIIGVRPGRYRVVAAENFSLLWGPWTTDSPWYDAQFLKAASALGTPVEVVAGEKSKVQVRTSTAELQDLFAAQAQPIQYGEHQAYYFAGENAQAQKGNRPPSEIPTRRAATSGRRRSREHR